jgi:murein DD-endopeptidase MepM/ murein hydrolase activator NlpD
MRRRVDARWARGAAAAAGMAALILGVTQGPYVNWRPAAAPLDVAPMLIRHDAKGDGRFLSPRSGNRQHRGVDIAAPLDAPVRAIRSGRVATAAIHRGLGKYVVVDHGGSLTSLYAHLNTMTVREGQRVRQGEQLGTVGKTGNARHRWITPHLHLEVLAEGRPMDPASYGLQIADLMTADSNVAGADADGGE